MYSESMNTELEWEGPSLESCKEYLSKKHGVGGFQILHWKTTLKPGHFFGLIGQKEVVSVSYVLVSESRSRAPSSASTYRQGTVQAAPFSRADEGAARAGLHSDFQQNRDALLNRVDPTSALTNTLQLGQLSKAVEKMGGQLNALIASASASEEHPSIAKVKALLAQNEFTPSYIKKLAERLHSEFSLSELDDFNTVRSRVVDWIAEDIHIAPPEKDVPPRIVIIIGPTGVGKTTTIAKMGAKAKIQMKNKGVPEPRMLIVTIDKMRVGAVEQLEHWGAAMEVPIGKADDGDDLRKLLKGYEKEPLDYLFIDTSGYSPTDYQNIAQMRSVLDVPGLQAEIYLAFAANTKARDLETILRNYEQFNFQSVIITKLDETSTYGNVLSVLAERNKSVAWITDGQYVPNYIERASVMRFLKNLDGFQVDRERLERIYGHGTDDIQS
ncbi:MAG: hypothetical protein J1D88_01445 [Treponema sp.]|nr:hypothetical protein [Treponema sp.]